MTQIGFDSHIQGFLGFNDVMTPANPIPRPGGPENSLTLWGDQTDYPTEVFSDYGAAYSFMEYLAGRFGHPFLTDLHLGPENGLDSLAALLDGSRLDGQAARRDRVLGDDGRGRQVPGQTGSRSRAARPPSSGRRR